MPIVASRFVVIAEIHAFHGIIDIPEMSINVSDHLTIELGKLRIVIKILLMFVHVAERGERLLDVMTHGQHGKGEVRSI